MPVDDQIAGAFDAGVEADDVLGDRTYAQTFCFGGKRFDDIVWAYPAPIPEIPKIANLLSFYNERVDIFVDGEPERPRKPDA